MKRIKIKWNLSMFFIPCMIVYSMMLVNQGLTVTDTGYNYGNFVNFDSLDTMWKFSTYFATAVGAFFTHLPFGDTMLGLNFYSGFVKALIAVMVYCVCVYEFKMKKTVTFAAEMVALGYCWCPTALLYNYITYLLFNAGALLLCVAVKREKKLLYFFAGVCLGVNVMVRLPNLAEMVLILALWYYCIITKTKIAETLKRTGICVLGYCSGIGTIFSYICIRYGMETYFDGISQMLAVSEMGGGYSLKTMIRGDIESYIRNSKWLLIALVFVVMGTLLYTIFTKRFLMIKRGIYLLCNFLLIHLFRKMHMFGYIYHDYQGIYYVGIFFLIIAGVAGLCVMFFGKKDYALRMHAVTMGLVILITPLGSNNYLFSAVNNIFWAVPFVFHCAYKLAGICKKQPKRFFLIEPLTMTMIFLLAFISMQGLLFGSVFVFRDGIYGEKRTVQVENNAVLRGMYTSEENGKALSELNRYLNEKELKGTDALLYYNVPSLSFYMDLKPAISSTWPDLDSYSIEKFASELERLRQEYEKGGYKPLIIMGCVPEFEHPKMDLLREHMRLLDYECDFENNYFWVYR